ncbi:hypothetical protein DMB92_08380 [Campylobacter sp. MIT 99-7217]|uniref:hypothetical protein n=1 Tax=Campylobacter sp. MIT 99-7217 TaxID=535091 RepID=UPI0011592C35|nr:hypothetical protein [Campylobacter sp. MIT 99-7217]TQR29369.1 hypothetical protein DMB92_08380 [Campylobacter sp. MIT 99-7217]
MKKISLVILASLPVIALADCASLASKYSAPDPASKTMAQIERWVKNKVDNAADANELRECLLARAADNPNQASFAGK